MRADDGLDTIESEAAYQHLTRRNTLAFSMPNGPGQWMKMTVGQHCSAIQIVFNYPQGWEYDSFSMTVNAYR